VTRIPADAFDFYVSLDADRSYQTVAEKYGVSKRAVTECAKREQWPERLSKIEQEAREKMDKRLAESLEERRERHLTVIRAMLSRSVAALQKYPLNSAMDAVKTAEKAIKLERLVVGEVADRTAVVEEIVKREYEQWMEHDAGEEEAVP
jgi:predicted DNA-binding protein YlxM (UPF0122 family)